MNAQTINKLLTALNECTEWGQVASLNLLHLVIVNRPNSRPIFKTPVYSEHVSIANKWYRSDFYFEFWVKFFCGSFSFPLIPYFCTLEILEVIWVCSLFVQVFILDSLSNYNPKDEREAQSICERITPRLAHANAAVVLSAVKVLMKYMEMMQQVQYLKSLLKRKICP